VTLWSEREDKTGQTWIGVPKGNRVKLKKLVGDNKLQVSDKRPTPKMQYPLAFTGKLRSHQKKPIAKIIEVGYGVLKAPPRAGKTVMAVKIACALGLKTLIVAAQQEWLDEFYRTFCGNDTEAAMSNAPDIEKFEGTRIVGMCKTVADFQKFDVCLATYQTFITKGGKAKLKKIRSAFGLVIVDEVHFGAATEFSKVLLGINARHMIGLTGTDDRKDGMYPVVQDIIGPVKAQAFVETLLPTVKIIPTPAATTYNYKQWVYAMRYLANHKERNKLIVKHAVHDIKQGRSIVIPVTLVKHATLLANAINKRMGEQVAVAFVSQGLTKAKRQQILKDARSYKIKCVVGIRSLVQTGVNVPRWDTLYEVMPISNEPKFTQETARIRTTSDDKKPPLIKHFLEDFGPSKGCFRVCWWQTYVK
jgi:superfamily II DNA or RNA helicase